MIEEAAAKKQAEEVAEKLLALRYFDRTVLVRLITKAIMTCQSG